MAIHLSGVRAWPWGDRPADPRVTVGAAFVFHGWYKIMGDGGMAGWMHSKDVPGFMQAAAACRSSSAASA